MALKKRKWLVLSLVIAMVFVLIPVVGMAEEAGNGSGAKVVDLIAGQHNVVGTVTVTNDNEKICVTYALNPEALEEGWLIYETHLYVGGTDEFPLTRPNRALGGPYQANPIPGQFPYGDDELDGVEGWTKCISFEELGVGVCDEVYISAHAVIERKVQDAYCEIIETGTLTPELSWLRSSECGVASFPGLGAQWTKEQGFAIHLDPDEEVWDGGTVNQNFTPYSTSSEISWASWRWEAGDGQSGIFPDENADLRRFQATFNIPEGYDVTGGTLSSVNDGYEGIIPINDNIYIFVNEDLLFWGGTMLFFEPSTEFLGETGRAVNNQWALNIPETDGWYMPGTIPAITSFAQGINAIDVFAEEFSEGGGMHELCLILEYEIKECYPGVWEDETAWGKGDRFNQRGNWGMWFTYKIYESQNGDEECQKETAWGGNSEGGGAAWWYYYDANVGGSQTVWADQDIDVGTVEVVSGTVYITLTGGWELQDDPEAVKIQGYNEIPGSRPAAGLFTGYKGTELTVGIGEYTYYAIHLDVQLCE